MPYTSIEETLRELGVHPVDVEEMKQIILAIRRELAQEIETLDKNKVPRHLAIVNSSQSVQAIDMLTDQIAIQQGLLKEAMKKQEIHDRLAFIKAKLESLVVERDVQARTINNITQQLKRISLNMEQIAHEE